MKKFVKSLLAISIYGVITISPVHAAQYKVEPISDVQTHQFSYGQTQNGNSQEYVLSGANSYDFPVVAEYLASHLCVLVDSSGNEFLALLAPTSVCGSGSESIYGFISDPASFIAGDPNATDLALSFGYLQALAGNFNYQQVNELSAFVDLGNGVEQINIWDKNISIQYPKLTRSTQDYISGISSKGWLYGSGSAPYLPYTFTDNNEIFTYWLSDFTLKGFVSLDNGNTITPVESPFNLYGGVSAVLGMAEVNGNQVGVGYGSISYNATVLESIESTETNGCKSSDLNAVEKTACIISRRNALYYLSAFKWTFDDNGNITDTELLGSLIENKHVDDNRYHVSHALAINTSGVAVGYSTAFVDSDETNPTISESVSTYAVIFKDGEVIDITEDRTTNYASRAFDINENGIAVGHVTENINGSARTSAFYIDTNIEGSAMTFTGSFFNGSSSSAKAINDNGFIVGEAEYESHSDTQIPRRRNAFLYDTNTETLTNINDFLECNSGYEIIEAKDINNLNEITATALIKASLKDAKGELLLDEDGNIQTEDVVQAVKLTPIVGEIVNCDAEEGKLIERQGASFSWLLILLSGLVGFQRSAYARKVNGKSFAADVLCIKF